MAKPVVSNVSGIGQEFTRLLIKAAGLDGKRVKSLECRVATNEIVSFKAELMGTEEDIGKALGEESECGA